MMREMPMSQPPIKQSELPVILNKIAYNPRYAETVSVFFAAKLFATLTSVSFEQGCWTDPNF